MRRLTALMCSDIVDFNRIEEGAVELLEKYRRVIEPIVSQFNGNRLTEFGSSQLSSFDDAVEAIECAVAVQQKLARYPDLKLRIAIHIGDVIVEDDTIGGEGVDVVSQIVPLAAPNGICISGRVYRSGRVQELLNYRQDIKASYRAEVTVENMDEPRSVFTLVSDEASTTEEYGPKAVAIPNAFKPRLWLAICGLLLLFLGAGFWWYGDGKTEYSKPSVAVLPFEDFSPEEDQQWFSYGLSEEILNSLVRLGDLYVPARTSSFSFRNKNIPIQQIADSLDVNHIVEGSVRRSNGRIRIAVQLIRAESGGHLWSKTYDRSTDSVFVVQKDIAEHIATTLDIYLDEKKRKRMFAFGTRSVEAYEAFLKGEEIYYRAHKEADTPIAKLWEANRWYDRAIRIDSTFAFPYHQRTDAYYHYLLEHSSVPFDTLSHKEAYERIIADFNRSIRHSNNPSNRLFYRFGKLFISGNWEQIPELVRKIHDNPQAYQSFVLTGGGASPTGFIGVGYPSLARDLYREKLRQDPLNSLFKMYDILALLSLDKAGVALTSYEDYLEGAPLLRAKLLIFDGQRKKAESLLAGIDPKEVDADVLMSLKLWLGMEKMNKQQLNSYLDESKSASIKKILSYAAGYPDAANSYAGRIDTMLLGCKKLTPLGFGNVLVFDLNATPNLSRCYEQAEIDTESYTLAGHKVRRIVPKEL